MDNTAEHLKNIKLLQEIYKGKKFFVQCSPMDIGAKSFPNTNFAVKEIDLPNFSAQQSIKEEGKDDCRNIVKEMRVDRILNNMMESDMKLYEQILDTNGFSFYFNELTKLAQK